MNGLSLKSKNHFPLLSNQKRLWILSQQDKTNPAYNLQLTYHFNGEVNHEILERSIGLLFDRHHTLFSVFRQLDGDPYVEIFPRKANLRLVDFSEFPVEIRRDKIISFASKDSRNCFDLNNGPLFRLYLLREDKESYYLHATIHHIIFDGWSRRLFVQELSGIYTSLLKDIDYSSEPLDFQSYDYAKLENGLMTAEEEADLISFWKNYLQDCPSELRLPCDYPRKGDSTGLGRRESFELSKDCTSGLKDLSRKENVSLFNTVLSLIGVLFQKYSGENDICIGVPASGRRYHPALDKIFGLFINTVPVRLKIDDTNNFRDLVSNTGDALKKALSNSRIPFEKIVEAINPERTLGINPLFQISLSWLTDLTIPMDFAGIKGAKVTLPEGISPFDITFYVWDDGDTIKGDIEYNIDIFAPGTILRLKENLLHLADSLALGSAKRILEIPVISRAELEKINGFNKTDCLVSDCRVEELFESQVPDHATKTAIVSGNIALTYKELDERANQVARYLLSLGLREGDVVGICLERSAWMVVSVFGVMKAGCCYLPLDPSFPDERLNYMFEDSGAKILISQSSLKDKFIQFAGSKVVLIETDKEKIDSYSTTKPDLKESSKSAMYIIYTSGSTGKPKGVMVYHRAAVNLIECMSVKPGVMENDVLLAVVTLSFDMSVFELFVPLAKGATIVVAGSDEIFDGSALIRLIEEHKITVIQATPSFWNILLANGWKGRKSLKALCGGEALTHSLVRQILPKVGEFWNCYGPTEATVYATFTRVNDADAPILIGKPVNNTSIHILDKNYNQFPIGATGEVCIGGMGVAKGYHNRPELTEEKFIDLGGGQIVYRTGDLGRYIEDGNIELFGRIDNQIKLRGFRIEPGEIESLLTRLPGVKEAVVKVHRFDEHDDRLVTFLNADSGFNMIVEEIKNVLSQSLPPYMIPSYFKLLDGFPRLPNGKIDKKALIYEVSDSESENEVDSVPLTEIQQRLKTLWGQILMTQNITAKDDFFDIGGNSLLGIRLLNRIGEELGATLTYRDFFSNSRLGQMGSFIDGQLGRKVENIKLEHLTMNEQHPLTINQKRLWLISRMHPDSPAYTIRMTYKFQGHLNQEVFEKSLSLLFERHHVVFSVIKDQDGEPWCEIVRREVKVNFSDFTGLPEEERIKKINTIFNDESGQVFDLTHGPLYRLFLIRTAKDEYYFRISIHHIIFDGWSTGVLANDLSEIYNSQIRDQEAKLEKLQFQQYDYAHWEKNTKIKEESVAFWKENLTGCSPMLNFPYDIQRGEHVTERGSVENIQFPKALSDDLRRISMEEGPSLFTTLLSAFGVLLNKYSGDNDLNIGLPVVFRPHSKLEQVFGMFVNTVVVRLKYEKDDTFRDVIRRTNKAALNSISHQDVPFETVVETIRPERISHTNPLFQVAFAWQNDLNKPLNLENIKIERVKSVDRASIFDITLYLWENGDIIEGEIEFNRDILKPETIKKLKLHFLTLLASMAAEINAPVRKVLLISDEEVKMIGTVNDTFKDFTTDKTIVQLFERSVMHNPRKIAIEFDGGCLLTYSELNAKANQLAGVLETYKIVRGDFVGILLKRSPELIITLLALYKTGAAYVPLNLTDPVNRISSILDSAKIKYVITNDSNGLVLSDEYVRLNIEQLIKQSEGIKFDGKNIELSSADSAYIIFTSGTTGKPKGVLVNHRSVINLIEWVNETFKVSSCDKLLWVTNLSFDLSVYDIFGILLAGGIVRILSDKDRLDPQKQYEIVLREGITFWDSAPQSLQEITRFFDRINSDPLYHKLRLVFLSGDWIPLTLPQSVTSNFPSAVVVGLGGATEATVWSNYYIIRHILPEWKSIPYGKPIQNARYYILDDNLNHCWIQRPGDLYIGGECLALGYYNDIELTNMKFIQDPFNPGSRLYLTGDRAQWMPDGNIEFLGRNDEQIKVRGYRVELGEIKNTVIRNKTIKEAIVIPDKSDRHNIKVILFILTHDNIKLENKNILRELKESLPEYMIPSDIIQCENFPVTSNGKIDTKALLSTYLKFRSEGRLESICDTLEGKDTSLTATEKFIHQLWCEVLTINNVLITDDFFDIGGYSLLVITIINQVREKLGINLTFSDFLSNPTIEQLGAFIDYKIGCRMKDISSNEITEATHWPLTHNQKRLWLISQVQPGLPTYIIRLTYKLLGFLNRDIFEKSLRILFERHHIMFSVIKEEEGEPYCEIVRREVRVSYLDYTGVAQEFRRDKVTALLNKDSVQAFDLARGPLYRLYLIKTALDEHYFHMSIHHIIFDGWSQGVFVNDLNKIYNSLTKGEEIVLEELTFQQYDYAKLEADVEIKEESVAFWNENLRGCSPVLNFPYDYPRNRQFTGRGGLDDIRFSKSLSDNLRRISKEERTSLFATLMSAFGVLLHKYSGDDDLNIGFPVAYRPYTKLEKIIGMFVNTVVVRLRYEKGITFRELINQCSETVLNAISHQDLPFERVVEIVKPDRISNANPLFQVDFAWQNNLGVPVNLEGITSERIKVKERAAIFDLSLNLWENGDFIEGELEYNLDILKPETVARLKDHFLILVNNLVENKDIPVSSVPMITDEEKRMIIAINNTQTNYPKDKTPIHIFEEQVSLYPDKTAVVFKGKTLTYKELNERANQLGRTLRKNGVTRNVPVGLLSGKSIEMIIGILGILKAGGGYVPIDPEYPDQRLEFIIKDSACRVLLTQDDKYNRVAVQGVTKFSLDSENSYHNDKSDVEKISVPSDLAYIIYTSGTTGIPKGTPIPQCGVVRMVCNANYIDIKPEDRVLQASSIVFDASVEEIFGALLNGATLYIITKEILLDPNTLGDVLATNNITYVDLTSSLFTQIVELRTDIFHTVKYLVIGGDVVSAPHVNKVRKDNPQIEVVNCYGPTENSCNSTAYRIDRNFESNIPIGKPVSNTRAYIFDKNMNYQPVGIIGELYVGGDGLSSGYLNREDLNRTSFIVNPYKPGERLYKTGDRARWLPDGNIEFHGRADNQLKIRGFRVELEEIESVLSEIEGVIEAVVKPVKIEEGNYKLVAFLNVPESFETDTNKILVQIKTKLPAYMVPSELWYMNGFPMTATGKIDRQALIFETGVMEKRQRIDFITLTPTQQIISKIWCNILKTDYVLPQDNFFDSGGNSLSSLKLLNRLRVEFGATITFGDFLLNSTLEQLGIFIDNQVGRMKGRIYLEHLTGIEQLPLTSNQKRLWLISQLQPGIPTYIIPLTYRFNGSLNREVFEKSLGKLFERHNIVFSVIKEINNEPYCEIVRREVKVSFFDYTGVPEERKLEKVRGLIDDDLNQVFDLNHGPLYRLYLIKTATDEYYFHMSIHHIIFDGWSCGVFVNDLSKIYNSLITGEDIELEEVEYQQYDYAQWEANAEINKESVAFWEENLRECSPVLNFPYDFPRGEHVTGKGSLVTIHLSKVLSDELRRISMEERTSLFTTMMSAFGLLLHKYSGDDNLNIGLPVAYRPHSSLESILGMFVNTVVVRLNYEKGDTFRDLMKRTHEAAMRAISHQDVPFDKILEIVKLERIPNTNPLFQIGFEWQSNLSIPLYLEGIRSELVRGEDTGIANFDITLALWEKSDSIEGELHYNTDILRNDSVVRLRENYIYMLESLISKPEQVISEFSLVSENNKKILDEFNNTKVSVLDCLVQKLFEIQAETNAKKTAVVCGNSSLTYKELDEKSNQLARYLLSLGVSGGDVIGICLERSVGMVISVLGVIKAGCCYLPMDPSFPQDRLNYMFEDSGARVLLTHSFLKHKFDRIPSTSVVMVDTDEKEINKYVNTKPDVKIDPQSLAYIIYTSGSTGKPKGVKVHHQAVVNFLQSMAKRPGISHGDRLLAVTTLSFDISVLELFLPLSFGAELVIADTKDIFDGQKLSGLLEKNDITIMQATPATWNILLSRKWSGKKNLKALCGGEAILPGLVKDLLPKVQALWNMYGPTETTVWSTCNNLTDSTPPILIGTPIDNTTIHILDKNNKPLPIGVTGEVCIGGLGVTKGYHNKPELTAEKFIKFENNQIIYKTGDLGRFLADGNVELYGRIDNQIKLRGFRIEPGEIESLLSDIPNVREAVVKVQKYDENDERLVAFLNVEDEFRLTKEEITGYLSRHLPAYMIPSFFNTSNGFPRLPNGKINKKALTYEVAEFKQKRETDLVSLTATQEKLLVLWGQILKIQSIKLNDNFFEIGGNSLLGIRLINRIREEFGIAITFTDFLSNSTLKQLGEYIDGQIGSKEEGIILEHLTQTDRLPLTSNQKRLWLISQLQPDTASYVIPATYMLSGSLNKEVFEKSLGILFERHHIVFSVIKEINSEPFCEIVPGEVKLSYIDYTEVAKEERKVKVTTLITEDSMKAFDLSHGPLYRLYLIKTAEEEYYFHMSIHHIIFDGWSKGVFVNDLSEIYNSLINGKEIGLEALKYQQYDYAKWEANAEVREESVAFWKENLRGCSPVLNFPYDFQRSERKTGSGGFQSVRLKRTLSKALKQISKEEDSSLFTTLLTAFGVQMHKYSGEDDINIGLPVVYRPHSNLENIFGMFVNTVVVRLKYEKGDTFRDLIRRTHKAALNAISHQDVSFDTVVEIVRPERISGANPLFQVALAWQNNLNVPINLEGMVSEAVGVQEGVAIFDITLALWENGDIIEGLIEYNKDLLSSETIARLNTHFQTLFENLVENIDEPIDKVSSISEEEIKKISEINNTATNYPREKTITELFEENANMFPDKIAIVCKGEFYTYRQLNEKSNQLARTLRVSGITKNIPVGLFADKSLEMMTAILGILKAGGCYTPIDPEYPEQRINFIVKDSGMKVLLMQDKYMAIEIEGVQKLSLNSEATYDPDNSDLQSQNNSEDLAYILYTSGTTGIPKGTPIQHRGVVRLVRKTNFIEFTAEDRVFLSGAIVFDATTLEIWGTLINGASLYVIDKETLLNPDTFAEEMAKNEITIFITPAALFTHLAENRADLFNRLKYLVVGGDVLSASHSKRVRKANPNLILINAYGPTENSCTSTFYKIDMDFESSIPIGKPNSNSTAYIFDKDMNYQPIGVVGELYVGGDGLSPGYLNREDLNRSCFIENPYNPGERLYKTGDLARWLPDWNIEFRGRTDNQLKIRGFRVELEEIESVLSQIEGVIETVIKPVKVEEGDYRLVAFLNVPETFNVDTKEILMQAKVKLPSYMVPSAIKYMKAFPKTINGKTDRKALIFDTSELGKRESIDIKILTPTERKIYKIWIDILKTDDLLLTDSFFDIGGNSLLSIRLINQLKEEFGFKLTFRDFLANPTISQLGIFIDSQTGVKDETINLVHLTETDRLPLTSNQKRLWLISKLQPDIASYIMPFTYKFLGSFSYEIFKKSLDILFHRHHIMFSAIREVNNEPYCEIVPSKVEISFIDYSGLPENEKSERVNAIITTDSSKCFDLAKGPLYRIYLIMTGNEEYYFHMSIHHIIFDGWSWSVLAKDLTNIYNSLIDNKKEDLEDIEFQQYDYAQWERSSFGSKNEADSIEFWKENLRECSPVLNFPYDFQRTNEPSGRCRVEHIQFSEELSEKLRIISKKENASLFAVMLSAVSLQMHNYSGEDDINIGLPVIYRPHSKLENIIGMFVNTVVVRLRYSDELTFRDLIRMTNEAALNAIAHQDLPFEKIVEVVNPVRSSNANPLFQVGFTWQHVVDKPLKLNGIKSEKIKVEEGSSIFDISFYMWETVSHIEGAVECNLDLFRSDTLIKLKNNLICLLESVAANPDQPVSEISYLSEDDRKKIEELNDTDCEYEHTLCIHHKFEIQAKENPDLPALVTKDKTLSYKELDYHANRMANYLIMKGIKVEDKIGICIDRSLEMMISIFGTLKAGAAYLPLSPENPTERLRSIINDANPKLIFAGKSSAANIPEECEVVFIDNILQEPLSENSGSPDVKMNPRNLAYVLYTSGSTGTPKGVMIEHHSVLNRLGWMQKAYHIDKTDTLLQKTPITFDVSVWELYWWFFNGARLILLPKGGEKDPETLIEYIADFRITTIHFVPSMFASFFETIVTRKLCGKLENMKRIFLSGEILPLTLVRNVNETREFYSLPDLINLYGPTEATVDVSYFNCPRENIKNVYIGKPIDNTKLFVVNGKNIIQPIGVPGELIISGVNLARGYLNRTELTAEKFFDFKIPGRQSIKAYHTGDLVRLTPEGEIDYLGRMDNQVKIRGFRIELGDIEAKILEHPMVANCAVIVVEKGQHKYLVAYICIKPGNEIEADKLRNYLSGKLPEYMVPPYIIFMETLPLTSSGKLNRRNLPAPDRIIERNAAVTPTNKNEKILFDLWRDLLRIENISINDNFFDLGGNSLLAINLANSISKEFNISLKALMIFEFPNIKAQSEYLSGDKGDRFSLKNIEIDEKMKSKKSVTFKRIRK